MSAAYYGTECSQLKFASKSVSSLSKKKVHKSEFLNNSRQQTAMQLIKAVVHHLKLEDYLHNFLIRWFQFRWIVLKSHVVGLRFLVRLPYS